MSNLQHRQSEIQKIRKETPFRQFLLEIVSWRNLMFHRTQKGISRYSQEEMRKLNIVPGKEYVDQYLGQTHTINIDDDREFFEQYKQLFTSTPLPALNIYGNQNENSDRCDDARNGAKNSYLSLIVGDNAENVYYSCKAETNVRNIFNSVNVTPNCETVYYSKTIKESFGIFYSKFIYSSSNVWFSYNLMGCNECILCNGISNQSYCINNINYQKEDYFREKEKILSQKADFDSIYKSLPCDGGIRICENSQGQTLYKCNNIEQSIEVSNISYGRNLLYVDGGNNSSHCYDSFDACTDRTHHLYGVIAQAFGEHIYCSAQIVESSYIYYSYLMVNCSYCLGCVNLTNKTYYIFNQQYSKEEWHQKVDEIFGKMQKNGTLGQFLPADINPYYFNYTLAYLIDPSFTKEEVTNMGYLRDDNLVAVDIPTGVDIIKAWDLGSFEGYVNEERTINYDITQKIIQDPTGNIYKIMPIEYSFLVKHGLPLPRVHRLDRMRENFRIS